MMPTQKNTYPRPSSFLHEGKQHCFQVGYCDITTHVTLPGLAGRFSSGTEAMGIRGTGMHQVSPR